MAADTVRRHEGRHVVTDNLVLAEGPPSLSNTLFLIVSHKAAEHNSRALKDHVASVVGSAHVHVVYGVPYGFEQVGRRLRYNEICAWVWIHKAFPRLHDLLQEQSYRCVVLLENNAIWESSWSSLLELVQNAPASKDIFWPGYIKTHRVTKELPADRLDRRLQGSKCFVFRGSGLCHFWAALTRPGKLYHMDMMLSDRLSWRRTFYPQESMFGVRRHKSACSMGRRGTGPVNIKRVRIRTDFLKILLARSPTQLYMGCRIHMVSRSKASFGVVR